MTELDDIVELPAIPDNASEWVRHLPSHGRFVDRGKLYDITGHLLFDSLLNSNGIRHFFFFMNDKKHVERAQQAFNGNITAPLTPTDEETTNQERIEVRVAFHLGQGICGHRGIV